MNYHFKTLDQTPFTLFTTTNAAGQQLVSETTQSVLVDADGTRHVLNPPGSVPVQYSSISGPAPIGSSAMGYALNNRGEVGGFFSDASGAIHGFTYLNGVYQQIDMPGASATWVQGVDDFGNLAGVYQDRKGQHQFEATPTGHINIFGDLPHVSPVLGFGEMFPENTTTSMQTLQVMPANTISAALPDLNWPNMLFLSDHQN